MRGAQHCGTGATKGQQAGGGRTEQAAARADPVVRPRLAPALFKARLRARQALPRLVPQPQQPVHLLCQGAA
jgi:hypothetical protein